MKSISVKNLVEFRRKKDKSRITYFNNLNKEKQSSSESGGDYWIRSWSAVRNCFIFNNLNFLDDKLNELNHLIQSCEITRTKNQYQSNINIILKMKDFDFHSLMPNSNIHFIKPTNDTIIEKSIELKIKPCKIFKFSENGSDELGAVWFVAKKNGYTKEELAMFTDALYRLLDKNYSNEYFINPTYCIAIDIYNGQEVRYSEILDKRIPKLIDNTLHDIYNIMHS